MNKTRINIVVIGHPSFLTNKVAQHYLLIANIKHINLYNSLYAHFQSGKSTLTGHLLSLLGHIPQLKEANEAAEYL